MRPPHARVREYPTCRSSGISGALFGLRGSVHIVDTTCKEVEKRVAPRAPILAPREDSRTALNVSETSPGSRGLPGETCGQGAKAPSPTRFRTGKITTAPRESWRIVKRRDSTSQAAGIK